MDEERGTVEEEGVAVAPRPEEVEHVLHDVLEDLVWEGLVVVLAVCRRMFLFVDGCCWRRVRFGRRSI